MAKEIRYLVTVDGDTGATVRVQRIGESGELIDVPVPPPQPPPPPQPGVPAMVLNIFVGGAGAPQVTASHAAAQIPGIPPGVFPSPGAPAWPAVENARLAGLGGTNRPSPEVASFPSAPASAVRPHPEVASFSLGGTNRPSPEVANIPPAASAIRPHTDIANFPPGASSSQTDAGQVDIPRGEVPPATERKDS